MKKLKIVKIGGNVLDSGQLLDEVLEGFSALKGPKILVHGGGKMATEFSVKLGITPQVKEGRRITSESDLKIVTMVYAGWINKNIVAQLHKKNCQAIGLSGADASAILAAKRPVQEIDYGWVGDVKEINGLWISAILEQGLSPVFSAITHDGNGHLLNTNADTIAAELAVGMSSLYKTELIYIFEKKGVLSNIADENSVIEELSYENYKDGISSGAFNDGMLPKLHNGFSALKRNVNCVKVGNQSILSSESIQYTQLIL